LIERCESIEQPGWLALRRALWPGASDAEHLAEMALFFAEPQRFAQFIAYKSSRQSVAFVEASVRHDCVNGTSSSPVTFLEGLYVESAHRRAGVAARLVATVAAWGKEQGCREFASDTKTS
jgi:aminoglycoside 6'-N-acetyltransferase I